MRIILTGPACSGKTTMAKHLSKIYGINYISTSMPCILEEYGIKTHANLIRKTQESPNLGFQLQKKILEDRFITLHSNTSYITDRGLIDCMVYFTLQNLATIDYNMAYEYYELAKYLIGKLEYTHQILLPPPQVIEDNGVRLKDNTYLNQLSSILFENIIDGSFLNLYIPNTHKIKETVWEERVKIISGIISS